MPTRLKFSRRIIGVPTDGGAAIRADRPTDDECARDAEGVRGRIDGAGRYRVSPGWSAVAVGLAAMPSTTATGAPRSSPSIRNLTAPPRTDAPDSGVWGPKARTGRRPWRRPAARRR